MDNLVLTRLAVSWSSTLLGMRLGTFRQESSERFRLTFASESRECSLVVSLDPTDPWIGEAVKRWEGPQWSPDRFVPTVAHVLVGRLLTGIAKAPADRSLRLDFGDAAGLALELTPHSANLVLLGEGGVVVGGLRHPKGARERLAPGRTWSSRRIPQARLDPFQADAREIDAALSSGSARGELPPAILRRCLVGFSSTGVELAVSEHAATGRSLGSVLRARLDSILDGSAEVLIERPDDASDDSSDRLLPWRPDPSPLGRQLVARHNPATTAATFFEARDAARRVATRIAALGRILVAELARTRVAEGKVREELRSFDDPDRYRRMGEALLASMSVA
jgi:predicted ribosome quality control (RQC) complex YloA/Tae2 family protein